jgi:hypothetical protein
MPISREWIIHTDASNPRPLGERVARDARRVRAWPPAGGRENALARADAHPLTPALSPRGEGDSYFG